jgi:mannose-6-phosphate isomerase-like protein (cupin superfamily)
VTVVETKPDYAVKRIDEMEHAFGGVYVRARASLGVGSFGMQVLELPPLSGDLYPEHDHAHDGQEEVYLLLAGTAELALPDRVVELGAETFVRVAPGVRRRIRTGPDGARVLAIGAMPGEAYTPQPNSVLGGPETLAATASSAMLPDGPPAQLTTRGRF